MFKYQIIKLNKYILTYIYHTYLNINMYYSIFSIYYIHLL